GSPEASTQTWRKRSARTASTAPAKGLGHGRAAPRIRAAASPRWRWPPNTTSARAISSRATGLNPAIPSSPIPTMDSQRLGAAFSRKTGSANAMQRILILGGTAEARQLAQKLAGRDNFAVTLSLAGRTATPAPQGVPVRVGGFGGSKGLAQYLAAQRINVL